MEWIIPGTVLTGQCEDAPNIQAQFEAMFLAGDMVLGQVARLTGLEPYTVQNWVKRGFLSPPQAKHYSMNQLCRILNINMLKGALSMEQICGLLSYINGELDTESDDLIDDSQLYFRFVRLAALESTAQDQAIHQAMADYAEPVPGSRERIEKVLRIMLCARLATTYRQQTEALIKAL